MVGGPCLEKDSYILVNEMPENRGKDFVLGARKHNESIDNKICEWIMNKLSNNSNQNIGITGMAFKGTPDTSDLRGSPSVNIVQKLSNQGLNNIRLHDFLISTDELKVYGNASDSLGSFLKNLDLLVILTNNKRYKNLTSMFLQTKLNKSSAIFDAWGVLDLGPDNSIEITTLGDMFLKTFK